MAVTEHVICNSDALLDSGKGVHFVAEHAGDTHPAFVVRFKGKVRAYINRCPHSHTGLHTDIGRFFESQGKLFMCPVHGATFLPDTGKCVSGPCLGDSLIAIAVEERNGKVIQKKSAQGG